MDQLEAIRMFVRVVDSGSFSAVAREAGIGQPAVSKQIAALESRLGAQLLRRTSRSLSVTQAGQDFYESAVRLVDDLETAVSRVGRGQTAPSGLIRVTLAPVFGRVHVLPRLGEFFARFPDIVVEIVVTDRAVDLVQEGVDVAIHNGPLTDSSVVARKIAATPVVTVATPEHLKRYGEPRSPATLTAVSASPSSLEARPGPGASGASLARSSISPRGACVRTTRSRFARRSSPAWV